MPRCDCRSNNAVDCIAGTGLERFWDKCPCDCHKKNANYARDDAPDYAHPLLDGDVNLAEAEDE